MIDIELKGIMVIALCGMLSIILKRRYAQYGILSTEYPLEVITLTLLFGIFLCVAFLDIYLAAAPFMKAKGIDTTFPWTLITTLAAGPSTMLLVYWKHLTSVNDKISNGALMLANTDLTQRVAAFYYLERIAKENSSLFPTVIETLCAYIRSQDFKDRSKKQEEKTFEIKLCIDMISRLWQYHLNRSKKWNFRENLEPDLRAINLKGFELWCVWLNRFYLEKVNFTDCYLFGVNMSDAFLWKADFENADMDSANLKGAKVHGANFSTSRNLTQEQIDSCEGNLATKIPSHLQLPEKWKKWCLDNHNKCLYMDCCFGLRCQRATGRNIHNANQCVVS